MRRYGGAHSRPIGAVGPSLKSTKVDIEIRLASKGTRVTGSGISAEETRGEEENEREKLR